MITSVCRWMYISGWCALGGALTIALVMKITGHGQEPIVYSGWGRMALTMGIYGVLTQLAAIITFKLKSGAMKR